MSAFTFAFCALFVALFEKSTQVSLFASNPFLENVNLTAKQVPQSPFETQPNVPLSQPTQIIVLPPGSEPSNFDYQNIQVGQNPPSPIVISGYNYYPPYAADYPSLYRQQLQPGVVQKPYHQEEVSPDRNAPGIPSYQVNCHPTPLPPLNIPSKPTFASGLVQQPVVAEIPAESPKIPLAHNSLRSMCVTPRGQYPTNECNKYVNCWDDSVIEQFCPKGLVFNPKGYCDYLFNVECGRKPIVDVPSAPLNAPIEIGQQQSSVPVTSWVAPSNPTWQSSTIPPLQQSPVVSEPIQAPAAVAAVTLPPIDPKLQSKCLKQRGQFPTDNCNKYINCWDGNAVEEECPQGLLFSLKGYCDYAFNVDCLARTQTGTNQPSYQINQIHSNQLGQGQSQINVQSQSYYPIQSGYYQQHNQLTQSNQLDQLASHFSQSSNQLGQSNQFVQSSQLGQSVHYGQNNPFLQNINQLGESNSSGQSNQLEQLAQSGQSGQLNQNQLEQSVHYGQNNPFLQNINQLGESNSSGQSNQFEQLAQSGQSGQLNQNQLGQSVHYGQNNPFLQSINKLGESNPSGQSNKFEQLAQSGQSGQLNQNQLEQSSILAQVAQSGQSEQSNQIVQSSNQLGESNQFAQTNQLGQSNQFAQNQLGQSNQFEQSNQLEQSNQFAQSSHLVRPNQQLQSNQLAHLNQPAQSTHPLQSHHSTQQQNQQTQLNQHVQSNRFEQSSYHAQSTSQSAQSNQQTQSNQSVTSSQSHHQSYNATPINHELKPNCTAESNQPTQTNHLLQSGQQQNVINQPNGSTNHAKECLIDSGTFRDKDNCSSFYTCIDNQVVATYNCPAGLSFNDVIGVCDYAYRVDCTHEPYIYIPLKSNSLHKLPNEILQKVPAGLIDSNAGCKVGSVHKLNNQCSIAAICKTGVVEIVECPTGLAYDSPSDKCLVPYLARC